MSPEEFARATMQLRLLQYWLQNSATESATGMKHREKQWNSYIDLLCIIEFNKRRIGHRGYLRIRRLGVRIPSRAQVKLSVPFTPGAFLLLRV
jgi:hypothetical protein